MFCGAGALYLRGARSGAARRRRHWRARARARKRAWHDAYAHMVTSSIVSNINAEGKGRQKNIRSAKASMEKANPMMAMIKAMVKRQRDTWR